VYNDSVASFPMPHVVGVFGSRMKVTRIINYFPDTLELCRLKASPTVS